MLCKIRITRFRLNRQPFHRTGAMGPYRHRRGLRRRQPLSLTPEERYRVAMMCLKPGEAVSYAIGDEGDSKFPFDGEHVEDLPAKFKAIRL